MIPSVFYTGGCAANVFCDKMDHKLCHCVPTLRFWCVIVYKELQMWMDDNILCMYWYLVWWRWLCTAMQYVFIIQWMQSTCMFKIILQYRSIFIPPFALSLVRWSEANIIEVSVCQTQLWTFKFHKRPRILGLANWLLASQEGLSPKELSFSYWLCCFNSDTLFDAILDFDSTT